MSLDLRHGRKWVLVGPNRIDGLLSSGGNAVIIALAFIGAVRNVVRALQLRKINVLYWNVLNGRICRFLECQGLAGIGNHTTSGGHDHPSWISPDGNRMIWTWKLDLFFVHVSPSPFFHPQSFGSPPRCPRFQPSDP